MQDANWLQVRLGACGGGGGDEGGISDVERQGIFCLRQGREKDVRQGGKVSVTLLIKLLVNMTRASPDYLNKHLVVNAARWPEFSRLEIFLYLSICLFVCRVEVGTVFLILLRIQNVPNLGQQRCGTIARISLSSFSLPPSLPPFRPSTPSYTGPPYMIHT